MEPVIDEDGHVVLEPMPSLEAFKQLRQDVKTFTKFMTNAVCQVYGRIEFKKRAPREDLSKFVTVSTEAFALFVLEGNYDKWLWECQHPEEESWTSQQKKEWREKAPKPKYTNPLASRKNEGYTVQAIPAFLSLCELVAMDRRSQVAETSELIYRKSAAFTFVTEKERARKERNKENNGNISKETLADAFEKLKEFGQLAQV